MAAVTPFVDELDGHASHVRELRIEEKVFTGHAEQTRLVPLLVKKPGEQLQLRIEMAPIDIVLEPVGHVTQAPIDEE